MMILHVTFYTTGTVQSFIDNLKAKGQKPVPNADAKSTADKIGAFDYLECSAKEKIGVQEVFQVATRAAMSKSKGKKKKLLGLF